MTDKKARLTSLQTLFETRRGTAVSLPPRLARRYGNLRIPSKHGPPHVFSNFVTTLDGVVSLSSPKHASGGDISGFSAQDRMVMGLLRAVADVVIIGAGTLGADSRHVWTADAIFPELADEYRRLRKYLEKAETPLNVVVSGSGAVDLRLPIFASGKVNALILTTTAGERRLRREAASDSVEIRAIGTNRRAISPRAILDEVCRLRSNRLILVEGGPRLLGDFYAERLIDEQFLTIAPQVAGRDDGDRRPSLVMGNAFAPGDARWGTLTDVRRGGSHLFLRYSFPGSRGRSQAGSR
ncbi:MAG: dihydrofolate reductase family protein [Proteobacteria bacterium]|nr:dihydrofolate reductase family protein [Pseudomonadota bacterium]